MDRQLLSTCLLMFGALACANGSDGTDKSSAMPLFRSSISAAMLSSADVLEPFPANVKDFGAVGDGFADDTAAFQRAADAVVDANGLLVFYVPQGNYRICEPILFEDLQGAEGIVICGDGPATQIVQTTPDCDLFVIGHTDGRPLPNHVYVCDMRIGTVNGNGSALVMRRIARFTLERIIVKGAGEYGILLSGCLLGSIIDCVTSSNASQMFIAVGYPTDWWVRVEADNTPTPAAPNALLFSGLICEGAPAGSTLGGLLLTNGASVTFAGCTFENFHSDQWALHVKSCHNLQAINIHLEDNVPEYGACFETVRGGHVNVNVSNSSLDFHECYGVTLSGFFSAVEDNVYFDANCVSCVVDGFSQARSSWLDNDSRTLDVRGVADARTLQRHYSYGTGPKGFAILTGGVNDWNADVVPWRLGKRGEVQVSRCGVGQADETRFLGDFCAKVRVSRWTDGLRFAVPPSFVGQWLTIECWTIAVSGEPSLWLSGEGSDEAGRLQLSDYRGGWVKTQAKVYWAHNSDYGIMLTTAKHGQVAEFYLGAINIWAESNAFATDRVVQDGDTTPSLGLNPGRQFLRFDNSMATTVSTLDDAVFGAEVVCLFENSNTTLDFAGTNMHGPGGPDFTGSKGDWLVGQFDGSDWFFTAGRASR